MSVDVVLTGTLVFQVIMAIIAIVLYVLEDFLG